MMLAALVALVTFITPLRPLPVEVATVYHAVTEQTDNTPRVTADGTHITGD